MRKRNQQQVYEWFLYQAKLPSTKTHTAFVCSNGGILAAPLKGGDRLFYEIEQELQEQAKGKGGKR